MSRRKIDVNPFNSISSILILVLLFVGLFFVAKSIFTILSWVAPIMLIATLIIDHKVVLGYGKWIFNLLKENFLMGAGAVLLTVFGFPVISGFLLAKALLYRKVNKMKEAYETQSQGEYAEYEEVQEVEEIKEKPLELPRLEKEEQPRAQSNNEYEQLFDED